MLVGKLIFIKKTGGDGSKFPLTVKNILIGRSDECLIRIHNPQVALKHCQLITEDNGQVKLKILSNPTILNGKMMSLGEVLLQHGDVLKIGNRQARWEYAPISKYYHQINQSPGRLVAVVMPQQRSKDTDGMAKSPTLPLETPKQIQQGIKRRYTEMSFSEITSSNKVLKANSTSKINSNGNLPSATNQSAHSFQSARKLFASKQKGRKTKSEIGISTLNEQRSEKTKKSVSPSWKVKIATPPSNNKAIKRKSTPIKKVLPLTSSSRSLRQSGLVKGTNLKVIAECSPKGTKTDRRQSAKSIESVTKTNAKKSVSRRRTLQPETLVKADKGASKVRKSLPAKSPKVNRLSLMTKGGGKTARIKLLMSYSGKSMQSPKKSTDSNRISQVVNMDVRKTPQKTPKSSSSRLSSSARKSISSRTTPPNKNLNSPSDLIIFATPKSSSNNKASYSASKVESQKKSPKTTPDSRRSVSKVSASPRSRPKKSLSKKELISTPKRISMTTSDSLAQKAAKKLKAINPKKPDKNKKAALLLLGKAIRKQSVSQNVNILLKKKIVKKAIKQTTAPPVVAKSLKVAKFKKKGKKLEAPVTKGSATPKNSMPESQKTPKGSPLKTPSGHKPKIVEETPASVKDSAKKSSAPVAASKLSLRTPQPPSSPDLFTMANTPGSYIFNSNRRSSKRLSSKNDTGKPDYMELSPTALGLIPKNIDDIFKSPRDKKKRRSISLTTPKASATVGIIKSASTNKKLNRKSVRFSSKDLSVTEDCPGTWMGSGTPFKFENFTTPNISLDVFVSPLTESILKTGSAKKASTVKKDQSLSMKKHEESKSQVETGKLKNMESSRSDKKKAKCARKLLESPGPQLVPLKRAADISSPSSASKRVRNTLELTSSSPTLRSPRKSAGDVKEVINSKSSTSKTRSTEKENSIRITKQATPKSPVPKGTPKTTSVSKSSPKIEVTPKSSGSFQQTPKAVGQSTSMLATSMDSPSNAVAPQKAGTKSTPKVISTPRKTPKVATPPSLKSSPKSKTSSKKSTPNAKESPVTIIEKSPKQTSATSSNDQMTVAAIKRGRSPKNELTDLRGVKKLLKTPKLLKSPKNDLSDIDGVRQLLRTPRPQRSPKNDLTNVDGVRQLLKTPKVQKSPKNELNDLMGIKKLMGTPKVQKSPKNDLTNVDGVRQLLKTPRVQRNPKNDLTNVDGVRQLFKTPKVQKSPKNDLSDLRGVKKLLSSPKTQNSPKNDLSDLRGVKKLLSSPKTQKSPKNDLTDVDGVWRLLKTPRVQKSTRNSLTNVDGVRQLLKTPKVQKSPKNELNDLRGVKNLLGSPKVQKSPKNDLSEVEGIKELFSTPEKPGNVQKSSTPASKRSAKMVKGVKQLLVPDSLTSDKKGIKCVKGRRTIYATPKSPKNDLTDVVGVRQLFARHTPVNDLNTSLTGVAQLFDLPPMDEPVKTPSIKKLTRSRVLSRVRTSAENSPAVEHVPEKTVTRRGRSRTVTVSKEPQNKTEKSAKKINTTETKEGTETKKPVRRTRKNDIQDETLPTAEKQRKGRKPAVVDDAEKKEMRSKRGRSAAVSEVEASPPKLRKKQLEGDKTTATRVTRNARTRSTSKANTESLKKETTATRRKTANAGKADDSTKSKATLEVQSKSPQEKIEKKSRRKANESETVRSAGSTDISPRKTRSVAAKKTKKK